MRKLLIAVAFLPPQLAYAQVGVVGEMASKNAHDRHEMPQAPPFRPLTVNDIIPIHEVPLETNVSAVPMPGTARPDVVGAARFTCNMSHLSYDDPIAYPQQPGKAHLHHFFGNTQTDAFSTYESLRRSGQTTCQGNQLNRSAYWIPALLDGKGSAVVPDWVVLYYKRRPDGDPACAMEAQRCGGIPPGLRAIFGTNYILGQLQSPSVKFDCNTGPGGADLPTALKFCRPGDTLYARINAPDCWDSMNLDSADHQSHLTYRTRDRHTGRMLCPATHPVIIPELTFTAAYAILPGDTPETWKFSSDAAAGAKAGMTFHADYMEAWEPAARLMWEEHCIGRLLNCSDGDLGNGTKMKRPPGFTFVQRPHLVPVGD